MLFFYQLKIYFCMANFIFEGGGGGKAPKGKSAGPRAHQTFEMALATHFASLVVPLIGLGAFILMKLSLCNTYYT